MRLGGADRTSRKFASNNSLKTYVMFRQGLLYTALETGWYYISRKPVAEIPVAWQGYIFWPKEISFPEIREEIKLTVKNENLKSSLILHDLAYFSLFSCHL